MRAITNKIHTRRVCSNRAATRVNIVKAREKLPRPNASICSNFASYRNLQKTIAPPSHGGGHEFESRRVHSFFFDLQVKRGFATILFSSPIVIDSLCTANGVVMAGRRGKGEGSIYRRKDGRWTDRGVMGRGSISTNLKPGPNLPMSIGAKTMPTAR
jgi:hypothetical protein